MMPEEREQQQVDYLEEHGYMANPLHAHMIFLRYFDEHEPAVAAAIRYGLADTGVEMYGQDHGIPGHPQVMTFIKEKLTPQKWKRRAFPLYRMANTRIDWPANERAFMNTNSKDENG